jgi:hypothetical protein
MSHLETQGSNPKESWMIVFKSLASWSIPKPKIIKLLLYFRIGSNKTTRSIRSLEQTQERFRGMDLELKQLAKRLKDWQAKEKKRALSNGASEPEKAIILLCKKPTKTLT